jgi:thiamine biosynthesis lipoprotein
MWHSRNFRVMMFAALLLGLALLGGCAKKGAPTETRQVMGTSVTITVYDAGIKLKDMQPLYAEIFELLADWDKKVRQAGDGNQVTGLSRGAGQQSISADPAVFEMLMKSLRLYDASGQAFDIRYGPMLDLWGFDTQPRIPTAAELDTAKGLVANGGMFVAGNSILLARKGMRFDVREIALGYALDLAVEKLTAKGIRTAAICTPYVCRTVGEPLEKRGFRVSFPNPVKGDSAWAAAWVPAGGVALAASTEGRFSANGKTYHALLDPRTGMPAEKYSGALVQAADAATAQAMAYAMFVNGGEGFDAAGKAAVSGYVLLQGENKVAEAGTLAGHFELAK